MGVSRATAQWRYTFNQAPVHTVVGVPTKFPGYPAGTRAAALPDVASTLGGGFLQTFGKPVRESACECERSSGVVIGPVMALVSGPAVGDLLADRSSELAKLVEAQPDDGLLVNEIFLRILNRPSRPEKAAPLADVMRQVSADHESLAKDLAVAEAAWKLEKERLEQARLARIAAARRALDEATAAHEPTRLDLERNRGDRVAAAVTALDKHLADPEAAVRHYAEIAAKMPAWHIVKPTSVVSTVGAKAQTLPDGSVFVSGPQKAGVLHFKADLDVGVITGLRLEAIPDPRLPNGGSGRAADGSFVTSEVEVSVGPVSQPNDDTQVTLQRSQADFSANGFPISAAADTDRDNPTRGWSVAPRQNEVHWAVFELNGVPSFQMPTRLTVRIPEKFRGGKHGLGRFRISVTTAAKPLSIGVTPRAAELFASPRAILRAGAIGMFGISLPDVLRLQAATASEPGAGAKKAPGWNRAKLRDVIDRSIPELDKAVADYKLDEYYERALDLVISGRAREAFAIDREPAKLRDAYGRDTFGRSQLLARRLVEAGTRVVEVVWPKIANSDNHSWDHHVGLDKRMKNQSAPMLDRGLTAFITDMDERGLLEDTLVVAVGEFGRSPQKGVSTSGNGNSADGRDHWPYCFSAIVAGAGIRRGYVHGKSDATASAPLEDAVHPMQLLATIYHACGIEPETIVYNRLNQPRELVKGQAVTKLCG